MFVKTWDEGRSQAQANANSFGVPYFVFKDASGNTRVERLESGKHPLPTHAVFYPEPPRMSTIRIKLTMTPTEALRYRVKRAIEDAVFAGIDAAIIEEVVMGMISDNGKLGKTTDAKTVVHVNQHVIKANAKNGTADPVLTVKQGKHNTYCHEVTINGPCKVVYRPDKPLISCGAKVWIETHATVDMTIRDELLFVPPKGS